MPEGRSRGNSPLASGTQRGRNLPRSLSHSGGKGPVLNGYFCPAASQRGRGIRPGARIRQKSSLLSPGRALPPQKRCPPWGTTRKAPRSAGGAFSPRRELYAARTALCGHNPRSKPRGPALIALGSSRTRRRTVPPTRPFRPGRPAENPPNCRLTPPTSRPASGSAGGRSRGSSGCGRSSPRRRP